MTRLSRIRDALARWLPPLSGLALALTAPACADEAEDRVLLAVFAHADDETMAGPMLARYAREGADVHLLIATRGEKWAPQTDLPPGDEIAAVRAAEARCAAEALGINPPIQLAFDDGSLGERTRPPWATLARLEAELRAAFDEVRPDAVVTWGPEGGYGHPDHRLVGAVVTQLVQQRAGHAPERLFYVGVPSDRAPADPPLGALPLEPTHPDYLTMRVSYAPADLEAARGAFACYQSQFPPEARRAIPEQLDGLLQGEVFLRPWFGAMDGDDVFADGASEGTD